MIIKFRRIIWNIDLGTFMNLGLGDWDESTQSMNDKAISDNKDVDKILATVANIVIDFTDHFPEMEVNQQIVQNIWRYKRQ